MLARLQQLITVGLLGSAIAWAIYALSIERPLLAAAGALFILTGYVVALGGEFVLMQWVNLRDPLPAARMGEVVRAWLGEAAFAPRVFCWRQPFRSTAFADRSQGLPGQRGLVLVHGFVCNRGLWNAWYPQLAQHGVPYIGVNLEPVFGEIDSYAESIEVAVAALIQSTGMPPVIVAHSMGGLAVRAWLRLSGPMAQERVHHIVTLGTPHGGTALARFGFSANSRQMSLAGVWLDGLTRSAAPGLAKKFTCMFSNCDNIVFPTSTAVLRDSRHVHIAGCAHVQMADHPQAFAEVMKCLGVAK